MYKQTTKVLAINISFKDDGDNLWTAAITINTTINNNSKNNINEYNKFYQTIKHLTMDESSKLPV